ncbi:hypothetical protein EXIGLDRAFT_820163, partial [Exidia glandulosa HHB12029]
MSSNHEHLSTDLFSPATRGAAPVRSLMKLISPMTSATDVAGLSLRTSVDRRAAAEAFRNWNNLYPDALRKKLPEELRIACFEYLDDGSRFAVSHVSHNWRNEVVSAKSLWATYTVSDQVQPSYGMLAMTLERSAPVPFHFEWDAGKKLGQNMRELLASNMHRIETLSISWQLRSSSPSLLQRGAPMLKTLRMDLCDDVSLSGLLLPALRAWTVHRFTIPANAQPLVTLRYLALCQTRNVTDYSRLFAFVPNIIHLRIHRIGNLPRSLPPQLRQLYIGDCSGRNSSEDLALAEGLALKDCIPAWLSHGLRELNLSELHVGTGVQIFARHCNKPWHMTLDSGHRFTVTLRDEDEIPSTLSMPIPQNLLELGHAVDGSTTLTSLTVLEVRATSGARVFPWLHQSIALPVLRNITLFFSQPAPFIALLSSMTATGPKPGFRPTSVPALERLTLAFDNSVDPEFVVTRAAIFVENIADLLQFEGPLQSLRIAGPFQDEVIRAQAEAVLSSLLKRYRFACASAPEIPVRRLSPVWKIPAVSHPSIS